MEKLVHLRNRFINLNNVDYINMEEGNERRVRVFFNGSGILELSGGEADEFINFLKELDMVDHVPFLG
ncbi:MAG: hypothetical protein A4E57_01045 [Syntrophorhabdaceae bacterium PtaU1.Bin034]|jgi:hypothetical protein|nr:MAG: hypothetical protein A4E57_01045 [Syntrophorhabdaceae bacterium PtaU1.Bin034]